jgi:hypothetical protein
MIDLNRANLSDKPINRLVNELIERAEPASANHRRYLGASAIGSDCLRRVQYDWMVDPVFPALTVIEATRAGELLPRLTEDPEDWRCRMCGHRERCWQR